MTDPCPLCHGPRTYTGLNNVECAGLPSCPNYNASTARTTPAMPAVQFDEWELDKLDMLGFPFPIP